MMRFLYINSIIYIFITSYEGLFLDITFVKELRRKDFNVIGNFASP